MLIQSTDERKNHGVKESPQERIVSPGIRSCGCFPDRLFFIAIYATFCIRNQKKDYTKKTASMVQGYPWGRTTVTNIIGLISQ